MVTNPINEPDETESSPKDPAAPDESKNDNVYTPRETKAQREQRLASGRRRKEEAKAKMSGRPSVGPWILPGFFVLDTYNHKANTSPRFLADVVMPYLCSLSDIQLVIDEIESSAPRAVIVELIKAGSIEVSMSGAAEAIDKIREIVVPWRRKYSQKRADLELAEKQAEIEKKNAEVLEMRAQAAKTREERGSIEADAALKWTQVEELQLKNQKARLDLERDKMKMYLEFIGALAACRRERSNSDPGRSWA